MTDDIDVLKTHNARLRAEIERLISMEPWHAAEARAVAAERELAALRARYVRLAAAARKWAAQDDAITAALWEGATE